MGSSLAGMSRPTRRRLVRLERRSRDPLIVRRASAVRRLGEGRSVTEVSTEMAAARSSVQNWRDLFLREGEAGLQPLRRGAPQRTVTAGLTAQLMALVPQSPRDLGYLRNTWTSELLAKELARQHRQTLHASTVRRLLPKLGWVWRRSRPTLHIRDPRYPVRMAAIHRALAQAARPDTAVLHVDEADINLNPKLGAMWSRRGEQVPIPTPGQNRKRYLAGALDAHRGTILYTEGESKDTDLFLRLLEVAERHHGLQRPTRLELEWRTARVASFSAQGARQKGIKRCSPPCRLDRNLEPRVQDGTSHGESGFPLRCGHAQHRRLISP